MFTSESRLMLIAAHPDDESLACSIVLQKAVGAGAEIRVIYATDGENNPWPHRAHKRKWRLNESDREYWGKLRRSEALAALDVLGVEASSASFLALPDQALTELLVSDCQCAIEQFADIIASWAPTHLLVPSMSDTHPDHSALGVMLRLAWEKYFSGALPIAMWSYVVHGNSPAFFNRARTIRSTPIETATKIRAINCHETQLKLSRKRFLDHAREPERLVELKARERIEADGAISSVLRNPYALSIRLERSLKLTRPRTALFILGHNETGSVRCAVVQVPMRSSRVEIVDVVSDKRLAAGCYRGGALRGELAIPSEAFSPDHALFIKLERRGWFFDEAGWLELPAIVRSDPVRAKEGGFAVGKIDNEVLVNARDR